ncbi:MAG: DUF929 family protein [Micromonosporaceae bacterium]|nr:DUF929 family protein [Micromonosporaceae bacterium]
MVTTGKRSGAARRRAQEALAARRAQERRRRLTIAASTCAVIVVAVIAMVVISQTTERSVPEAAPVASGEAANAVVQTATSLSPSLLDQIGKGKVLAGFQQVTGQPALTAEGKPLVVYIGAEYCPYCASQRWPVVIAMSRFGTFANLGLTHSASDDIFPNTQSFSFHGSTYTSQYLAFQGVELTTNERKGNGYAPLDELTPEQEKIMETLNAPPYTDSAGGIPFMDVGNKYILLGGAYDAQVLQNKTAEEIAAALSNPGSPIAQGIVGTANMMTTYLCQLTGGQPGEVCSSAAAQAYQGAQ